MTFIIDASFGHAEITPAALRKIGAGGAILYAGCNDTRKNATKAEVQALLDDGLLAGLVIENVATDMAGGATVGHQLGRAVMAGARSVGYDVDNCVLYTAADWNTRGKATLDAIDACMTAFGTEVPHPGLYGNSYAIDRCFGSKSAEFGWQSDSTSFSYGPSPHACLLQRYNDPRAGGLPVDVNDIQRMPLGLMGDNDMSAAEVQDLKNKIQTVGEHIQANIDDFQAKVQPLILASLTKSGAKVDAAALAALVTPPIVAALQGHTGGITVDQVTQAVRAGIDGAQITVAP